MTADASVKAAIERRFERSPHVVFDGWLNPDTAGRWLFTKPNGHNVRCEIEPRVGGKFMFVDRRDGVDIEHFGTYVDMEPGRRLAFDFSVPRHDIHADRVTIDIVPEGSGCVVHLCHELKPAHAHDVKRTQGGWMMILDGLDRTLG